MSAAEIIEQIKALPAEEQAEVVKLVRELPVNGAGNSREEVKAAGDWAIANYPELLQKLAQ